MPCRDYYDDHPQDYYGPKLADKDKEIETLKKQISFAESALCAVLNAGEDLCEGKAHFFTHIDFPEAGITATELGQWQRRHSQLDAKHRKAEAARLERERKAAEAQAKIEADRKSALAKLTPAELKALGVK